MTTTPSGSKSELHGVLPPTLNTESIDEMVSVSGDEQAARAFALRLTSQFDQTGQADYEALAAALDNADLTKVAFVAHRMYGGAANVGALALADATMRIRAAAHEGDLPACQALLVDVHLRFKQSQSALNAWQAGVGRATSDLETS